MVNLTVKRGDTILFKLTTLATTQIESLLKQIKIIQNKVSKLNRLINSINDLIAHGPTKHVPGYSDLELDAALENVHITKVNHDHVFNPDQLGLRSGIAPLPDLAIILQKSIDNASAIISQTVKSIDILELEECFELIRGAVMIVFPQGLPSYDLTRQILDDDENIQGSDLNHILTDEHVLWWASKQLMNGKCLGDYVGFNEKTSIIIKIQKIGLGAPVREAPLDANAQKEMMAYYHRKQEQHKVSCF